MSSCTLGEALASKRQAGWLGRTRDLAAGCSRVGSSALVDRCRRSAGEKGGNARVGQVADKISSGREGVRTHMAVTHDGLLERVQLLACLEERLSLLELSLGMTYQIDVVAVSGRGPFVSAGSTRSSAHLRVSPQNHQLETTVGRDAPWSNTPG